MDMKNVARCVGLWLAEGDQKTNAEITFTNNCCELITFFHNTLKQNLIVDHLNPRVYIYSPNNEKPDLGLDIVVKYYIDKRARKPYYIYRIAGVDLVKEWHLVVNKVKNTKELFPYVLQGFFAGEGNVLYLPKNHDHRVVRIAQKKRLNWLENILTFYNVSFSFKKDKRTYEIMGRKNFEKLKKIDIACLHPEKSKLFDKMINDYSNTFIYYPRGFLKTRVLKRLSKPLTTYELSKEFNRSFARLQDVVIELKKEDKITNFRVKSKDYWIRKDQNLIIISKIKKRILNILNKSLNTSEIARKLKSSQQSTFNRLKELERLRLVIRRGDKTWEKIVIKKKVVVI